MKKAKKILTLVACAVLLVCISVGATIAYLTANTQIVTNTFTVGDVQIDLDEAKTDVYGVVDTTATARVKANSYKLIPNHNYDKDPTVHVKSGSEQCYVFVKVENGISAIEAGTTIAQQMAAKGWLALEGQTNVYYYAYATTEAEDGTETMTPNTAGTVVDARTEQKNLVVFEEFTLKTDAAVADYANASITIDAYAVQADGFDSAAAAWTAAPTTWTVGETTDESTGDDENADA